MVMPSEKAKDSMSQSPELSDRSILLQQIDDAIREANDMGTRKRYSARRLRALRQLHRNLAAYQELLMEQQVKLKELRLALEQEIRIVDHGQ